VDNPANTFTAATIVGTLGTFAIDAAGAWTFTANSAFDSLNAGGNVNETFAVHSADGTASSVKITINGTNDAPTVAAALSGSAAEGASPVNFNLLSGAGDADQGEAATLSVSTITYSVDGVPTVSAGTAVPAGITLNGNTLTVDPTNAAFNHLAFSQSMVIAVAFHVVDAQGVFVAQTQTVTVTGTNDAPVITVGTGDSAAATLTETNAGLTASGTVTLLDVDTSDLVTASVSSVVASGHITGLVPDNATLLNYLTLGSPVDTSGTTGGPITWNFNSGSEAFNYLAAGESLTLTYVIAVNDGKGGTDTQDITLTINGSTDSATVTAISSSTGIDPQVIEDFLTANNIDLSAYEIYYDNNGNNAGQDIWVGSMATDSITGGNRDVLIGGTGNDTLGTSGGSTIIWGGPGDDAMTGGASGDKFVYMRGDLAGTVIGDTIDVGNGGGDVIDLRDLLDSTGVTGTVTQGATANDAQVSYQTTTGSGVLSISINPTDKTVVISVDTDGGSASFQTLATVEGLVRNNPPSATALLTDLLGNSNSLQIDL
jgi:VCBS repeat-containing protein